jgi:ArsR family metal-binding transcriptional regulator
MLLTGYRKTMFRPDCNPQFKSLHCVAYLDRDISAALPYLNAVLGGFEYMKAPPSVTFFGMGRLITVHAKKIAINALKNEAQADCHKRHINNL